MELYISSGKLSIDLAQLSSIIRTLTSIKNKYWKICGQLTTYNIYLQLLIYPWFAGKYLYSELQNKQKQNISADVNDK